MGGGASSSLHAVSNSDVGSYNLGKPPCCELSAPPAIPLAEKEAYSETMVASWGHGQSQLFGDLARNPSLQQGDHDPHRRLGAGGRQEALRSPSLYDPGRSQALQEESQSSCPTSAWVQECELLRQEMESLRECVSLLLSECRHSFQELKDSLGTAKLEKGEANRMDFTQNKQQQQLEQHKQEQADEQDDEPEKAHLDSQQKLAKEEAATQGELDQLTQKKKKKQKTQEARSSLGTKPATMSTRKTKLGATIA